MSGILCNSKKDWSVLLHTLLCGSIQALFVNFVLLFSFQYEVTTKAKFFFVTKRDWQLSVFAFFVTIYSEYY